MGLSRASITFAWVLAAAAMPVQQAHGSFLGSFFDSLCGRKILAKRLEAAPPKPVEIAAEQLPMGVPRPGAETRTRVDAAAFERWVNAHPPQFRQGAAFLRKHFKLIPQADFESALFQAFASYRSQHPTAEVLLVHYDKTDLGKKSGKWVAALLKERHPDLKYKDWWLPKHRKEIADYLVANPQSRALLVDDASYSGTDIGLAMSSFERGTDIKLDRIDALVPFASDSAIQSSKLSRPGSSVYRSVAMNSIAQLLEAEAPGDRSVLRDQLRSILGSERLHHLLFAFEHRVADGASFPIELSRGAVYGKVERHPFLAGPTPVYHRPYRFPSDAPPRPAAAPPRVPRPTSAIATRIDSEALDRWVNAQPPQLQDAAKFLAKNIRLVRQQEFESTLFKTAQEYLERNPSAKTILIHRDENGKGQRSGRWVAALLAERFPHAGLRIETLPKGADALKADPSLRLLWVDDASYSGSELHESFKVLSKSVPDDASLTRRVDALVPYSSTIGSDTWKVLGNWGHYYFGERIPSVAELLERLPPHEQNELSKFTPILAESPFMPLTIFEHKMPDHLSFPAPLVDGIVRGSQERIPFIEEGLPVYREPYSAPGENRGQVK